MGLKLVRESGRGRGINGVELDFIGSVTHQLRRLLRGRVLSPRRNCGKLL